MLKPEQRKLNIGGEGEVPGCIQVNLPWILAAGTNFIASRNGKKIGVARILKAGPLVICDPQCLPFKNNAFDDIISNGVPIDCETHLGPGYSSEQLNRVCRNGFAPPHNAKKMNRFC